MILGIRKPFFFMLLASLLIGGILASFRLLHAFQYVSTTVVPETFARTAGRLDFPEGKNLFSLPLGETIDNLLENRKILSVKLDYDLPGRIIIRLNDTRPLALVLGSDNQTLYSMDKFGYIYHFDPDKYGFDYPIMTGLNKCRLYDKTDDDQIVPALAGLDRLLNENLDAYLTVSEINLTDEGHLVVYIDGLPFPVLTHAGLLYENIMQTRHFISGTNIELEKIKQLDLRSDGLIIAVK